MEIEEEQKNNTIKLNQSVRNRKKSNEKMELDQNQADIKQNSSITNNNVKQINVLFYQNKIQSIPDGDYIDNILKNWKGDIQKLEKHHGYIQWIFPINNNSKYNSSSQSLQYEEILIFKTDIHIANRVVQTYEMMLEFFGIQLIDKQTGKLKRSENYIQRYTDVFKNYQHNLLRITRMLKFLNLVGFRIFAQNFVAFMDYEITGVQNGIKILAQIDPQDYDKIMKYRKQARERKCPLYFLINHSCLAYWANFGYFDLRKTIDKLSLENNLGISYDVIKQKSVYFDQFN